MPEPTPIVEEANVALLSALGRPRTVLDVGCGMGLNGAAAVSAGASVVGIERVGVRADKARRLLGEVIELDPGDFEGVAKRLAGRKFDLVLFADVLEYAGDPAEMVRRYLEY